MKRKDTVKGCEFFSPVDTAIGNTCKEITDCVGGCDDS